MANQALARDAAQRHYESQAQKDRLEHEAKMQGDQLKHKLGDREHEANKLKADHEHQVALLSEKLKFDITQRELGGLTIW